MTLNKNALIVTMNKRDRVMKGDILIQDGVIKGLGGFRRSQGETIDARGLVAFPGFIQSHVHLNQTLFRNLVDDLPLLKWLKTHIWPMEAAHSPSAGGRMYRSSSGGSAFNSVPKRRKRKTNSSDDGGHIKPVHHRSIIHSAKAHAPLTPAHTHALALHVAVEQRHDPCAPPAPTWPQRSRVQRAHFLHSSLYFCAMMRLTFALALAL